MSHPAHDTSHVSIVPGFETKTLPAPSFNTPSPPAPDNTLSPPPPPAPVEYRDPSTGVTQGMVNDLIAAARAKNDPQYLARVISAAKSDGFSVPDQPGTVERIVKAPQDAASYQSLGDGSHWGL